jgi:hypothetical protein
MANLAARRSTGGNDLTFTLGRVPVEGDSETAQTVTLRLTCSPGDDAEPVLTILLPHED